MFDQESQQAARTVTASVNSPTDVSDMEVATAFSSQSVQALASGQKRSASTQSGHEKRKRAKTNLGIITQSPAVVLLTASRSHGRSTSSLETARSRAVQLTVVRLVSPRGARSPFSCGRDSADISRSQSFDSLASLTRIR